MQCSWAIIITARSDPGDHIIHAHHRRPSLIKAVLAADRTYDIVYDAKYFGWGGGTSIYLNVVRLTDERHELIGEWLKKEKTMVLSSDSKMEAERLESEQKKLFGARCYISDFTQGSKSNRAPALNLQDGY